MELFGLGVRPLELGGVVCAKADPAMSTKAEAVAISLLFMRASTGVDTSRKHPVEWCCSDPHLLLETLQRK